MTVRLVLLWRGVQDCDAEGRPEPLTRRPTGWTAVKRKGQDKCFHCIAKSKGFCFLPFPKILGDAFIRSS
jgi:hypothetical protein